MVSSISPWRVSRLWADQLRAPYWVRLVASRTSWPSMSSSAIAHGVASAVLMILERPRL